MRDSNQVGDFPNDFLPDRFLNNKELFHKVDKTFGAGRTMCLGKHFAITESLMFVASVILQGPFDLIEGNPKEIIREAGANLSPDLKIRIHLKQD